MSVYKCASGGYSSPRCKLQQHRVFQKSSRHHTLYLLQRRSTTDFPRARVVYLAFRYMRMQSNIPCPSRIYMRILMLHRREQHDSSGGNEEGVESQFLVRFCSHFPRCFSFIICNCWYKLRGLAVSLRGMYYSFVWNITQVDEHGKEQNWAKNLKKYVSRKLCI